MNGHCESTLEIVLQHADPELSGDWVNNRLSMPGFGTEDLDLVNSFLWSAIITCI
jgi:hypothetical protein